MSVQDTVGNRGGANAKGMPSSPGKTNATDFVPQPGSNFVVTPAIQELTDRALAYLAIGYAVHLSGPAGTGKTTLALHIASQLGRRCTLLHGDDELKGSDMIGRDTGYRRQSVRDNYVSSILKTEETISVMWSSNRLTTACEQGHTLIYDEFTRSPATANNAFLSVLEEGILNIPSSGQEKGYIKVHPDFRAIFTSNPEEYVGVHKTPDALLDRMITLEVAHQDRETELSIVLAKSKRAEADAAVIVDIIRSLRERLGGSSGPTIRAAIAIASIVDHRSCQVHSEDPVFVATCIDVLYFNAMRQTNSDITRKDIEEIVRKVTARSKSTRPAVPSTYGVSAAATNAKKPVTDENSDNVSIRIESQLDRVQSGVDRAAGREAGSSADFALAQKDAVTKRVEERISDKAKSADETSDSITQSVAVNRSLPRPPSFDVPLARMSSGVAGA
jgi:nitric oxide reductase NorQ protein